MALYKNREVTIISYDDNAEQSQVTVYNNELKDRQIVNSTELVLTDEEFNTYVTKRQEEKLSAIKKDRAELAKSESVKTQPQIQRPNKTEVTEVKTETKKVK